MTLNADNLIYFYFLASLILFGLSTFLVVAARRSRNNKRRPSDAAQ
jgi:hypothetical protein